MGHKIYETVSWWYSMFPTGRLLLKMDEYIKPACWDFNMEQEKRKDLLCYRLYPKTVRHI